MWDKFLSRVEKTAGVAHTHQSQINNYFRFFSTIANDFIAPRSVDLNIIGRCNLNCPWCWGPEHDAKEPVTFEQWKNLLFKLNKLGTESVIFSGGEPLLKRWLPDLAKYAHELGLRTTLSTNGIVLREKAERILPYIHDIGIPLDGHTHNINKIMRVGKFMHFEFALDAIKYVQSNYPLIDLTVRTVVARPNLESVPLIGKTLLDNCIDPERLRWKLYQINPIGPRRQEILDKGWLVNSEQFKNVILDVKQSNPMFKIQAQAIHESIGRYFIIFPDGKAHVIGEGDSEMLQDVPLGNIIENSSMVLSNLHKLEANYLMRNSCHGHNTDSNFVNLLSNMAEKLAFENEKKSYDYPIMSL